MPSQAPLRNVFPRFITFVVRLLKANVSLRVCVIYALISSLWILLSDQLVFSHITERGDVALISMVKGIVFVLATSVLIYTLMSRWVRALQRSEESYRTLIEVSPDAIALVGLDLRILMVNRRALTLSGYESVEDMIGVSVLNLLEPQERAAAAARFKGISTGDALRHSEYTALRKDGTTFPLEVTASLVTEDKRRTKAVMAILRDVTQRKEAEQALRAAEQRYREIFEHVAEGIYQSTPEGSFIAVNPALATMLGYGSPEELIASTRDIAHQVYVDQQMRSEFKNLLELQGSITDFESQLYRKDGSVIWGMETARVVTGERGEVLYYEGMVQDVTERRQAAGALRESEQRYRQLVEMSPDAVCVHSKGTLVFANSAAAKLLGASSPDALLGKPVLDIVHPDCRQTVVERVKMMNEEGKSVPLIEEKFLRFDGTAVDVEVIAIPFVFQGERAIQVVARDISARTQAEREIKLLAQTVASTKDCVSITDLDDRIIFANDAFLETYGYGREELKGKHVSVLRPGSTPSSVTDQIRDATLKGGWYGEIFNRRKDGTEFPIELWTSVVRNDLDEPVATVGVARDITERRKAEELMRKLQHAIEQSDEVIFMTESDGTITYVNPSFEHVYGFGRSEAIGKTPRILKGGALSNDYYREFWAQLLAGKVVRGELVNRTKGGDDITIDSSVSPIHGAEGSIIGFIAVQNDITKQKRADEERKRLEMELFQAQKIESVGTLAGGVAHDFNNILGIILGHATLLDQEVGNSAKFLKSRDSIIAAARRGASLVQQILTFARKTEISFETVNVNDTIADLVRMMEETFPKTISFSLRLCADAPHIEADRTRLHQTFLNLCVNARDAMPEGGTITISTDRLVGRHLPPGTAGSGAEEYLCVRISDTGVGMDASTQRRIFEPFFTTKPEGKGTGLGLAVVDGIMKSHAGYIEVESEPRRGTTFLLYFPVSSNVHRSTGQQQSPFGSARGGSETILLVEDEEALLDMVRGLLELKGYTVLVASNGEEALRLYSQRRREIALVVSDMGLPKLDGGNLYLQIRAANPEAKVVLVSGYVEPDTKAALLNKGVRAFVQKPYVPQEILKQVREVLDTV